MHVRAHVHTYINILYYLSCTSARPSDTEVDAAGWTSVGPTDSGETQHTEPTMDSASSLQIVLESLRTLLASEITIER